MQHVIRSTRPVARKRYACDACGWLDMYPDAIEEMTWTEKRQVVAARRNSFCIQPGQQYIKDVGIFDEDWYTFRAIPSINALCIKYNIYEL